jgi:hypothetical protein
MFFLQKKSAESRVIQEMVQQLRMIILTGLVGWACPDQSENRLQLLLVLSAPTFISPFLRRNLQLTIKSELYFGGKSAQLQLN